MAFFKSHGGAGNWSKCYYSKEVQWKAGRRVFFYTGILPLCTGGQLYISISPGPNKYLVCVALCCQLYGWGKRWVEGQANHVHHCIPWLFSFRIHMNKSQSTTKKSITYHWSLAPQDRGGIHNQYTPIYKTTIPEAIPTVCLQGQACSQSFHNS